MGGIASGKRRRRNSELRKAFDLFLPLPASDKAVKELNKYTGLDLKKGLTNEEAIAVRIVYKAIKGDNKSAAMILSMMGLFNQEW